MPADRDVLPTKVMFVNDVRMRSWLNDSQIAHVEIDDGTQPIELIGSFGRILRFARDLLFQAEQIANEQTNQIEKRSRR